MILVLMGILLLVILGCIIAYCCTAEDIFGAIGTICGIALALALIITIWLLACVITNRGLDAKIAMYEDENTRIESQLNDLVQKYMEYESNTYSELKGDSVISLINLYPELKADNLVLKQAETYQNNNAKIKELKIQKIDARAYKWWLCFGE